MKYFYALLALTVFPVAQAQNLSGRVVDTANQSIVGATVVVADSTYNDVGVSDLAGKFQFTDCPDSLIVRVSYVGLKTWERHVSVRKLHGEPLEVKLEADATEIGEVVVTARPPAIKKELGKFVLDDVARSPLSKGVNTETFLRTIPILNLGKEGKVSIMGKSSAAKIQINGRPANMSLDMIPARNIERIEIVAVPGAEYGDTAKGGVINVVLRKEINEGMKLTLNFDDTQDFYNSQSGGVTVNYSSKKISILGSVSADNYFFHTGTESAYNFTDKQWGYDVVNSTKLHPRQFRANVNLEYRLNEKSALGLRIATSAKKGLDINRSATSYRASDSNAPDSAQRSTIRTTVPFRPTISANLSYDRKFSSEGSRLGIDLYYGYTDNRENQSASDEQTLPAPTSIRNDYVQFNTNRTSYWGMKTKGIVQIGEDNALETGIYLYYYNMHNSLSYFQREGTKLGPAAEESNLQRYRDLSTALYATYDRTWSDKVETSVGIRGEYYWADGRERNTGDRVNRRRFDVLPFFSLVYMPHEDHELSLDMSSSVTRLPLRKLNTFKYFTSANEYRQDNPHLVSKPDYEWMLSYNFFSDYTFSVDYSYVPDSWTDFTVPDEEGNMVLTTANYGDSHWVDLSMVIQKRLFNNRWFFNVYLGADYSSDKGSYKGNRIDNRSWSGTVKVNNSVFLTKDRNWVLEADYKYSSQSSGPSFSLPSSQQINLGLQKSFTSSSVAVRAEFLLRNAIRLRSNFAEASYSHTQTMHLYPSVTFSFTHTFGNKQVRQVNPNMDQKIQNRLQ